MEVGKSTVKRVPKPAGVCIFCGGVPLTKEHLVAEWIGKYLPPMLDGTVHLTAQHEIDPDTGKAKTLKTEKGRLENTGDHRSRKLRVVCKACNNEWMSGLQQNVKSSLLPLILGEAPAWSIADRSPIAAWATMFTMVHEYSKPEHVASSQEQRAYLRAEIRPPRNWLIWAGRYGRFDDPRAWTRGIKIVGNVSPTPAGCGSLGFNAQVTMFTAGHAFFLAFSTVDDGVFSDFGPKIRQIAQRKRLRQVWPIVRMSKVALGEIGAVQFYDFPIIMQEFTNCFVVV